MRYQFRFYDFIGYLIPGSITLSLFYWFCFSFFGYSLPIDFGGLRSSIILIGVSYFLGHLIQAYGNKVEKKLVTEWDGWFSERFLRESNNYYTTEFKENLINYVVDVFDLSIDNLKDVDSKAKRQEIFNLCYSLVIQEGIAQHTEIFNGIYSLYRGMLSASRIGVIISLLVVLRHLVSLKLKILNCDLHQLWIGSFLLFFLIIIIKPLKLRFKRFSKHFANSVYRNFYVWYIKN